MPDTIEVVDSHTEGEPTRVVVAGWPQPAGATQAERREHLVREHDHLRRAVVREPRGHEAVVGALLTPPLDPEAHCGVVFFDNAGALGMCGHGLIGVVRTLEWLGRVHPGDLRIDTPVGVVSVRLDADGQVTLRNVAARAYALDVALDVPGHGRITGDVAWGGNWFFLPHLPGERLERDNLRRLLELTLAIKEALARAGIAGSDGAEIDHVELCGPPSGPHAESRNFVLCPGGAYDRSPCGTGTSAKLAVLHARGQLAPGQPWRQESITGGLFTAWLEQHEGLLLPHVRGRAFVTGRATLHFDPLDPLREGCA